MEEAKLLLGCLRATPPGTDFVHSFLPEPASRQRSIRSFFVANVATASEQTDDPVRPEVLASREKGPYPFFGGARQHRRLIAARVGQRLGSCREQACGAEPFGRVG